MKLTEKWREVFPQDVVDSYIFAETRDASAIMQATEPEAFQDLVDVLREFRVDLNTLYRPGGRLSKVAEDLDQGFRLRGWREAKYSQQLTTKLEVYPWKKAASEEVSRTIEEVADAEGHKIDNVKGRAVVDIEWNPKDGNLDRDVSNYVALYEGGMINVGVLVIRSADFAEPTAEIFEKIRAVQDVIPVEGATPNWIYRIEKTPVRPYHTSTTANFEKLVPRLQRGDGQGCPILAVGITWDRFIQPNLSLDEEVERLSTLEEPPLPRAEAQGYVKKLQELRVTEKYRE